MQIYAYLIMIYVFKSFKHPEPDGLKTKNMLFSNIFWLIPHDYQQPKTNHSLILNWWSPRDGFNQPGSGVMKMKGAEVAQSIRPDNDVLNWNNCTEKKTYLGFTKKN